MHGCVGRFDEAMEAAEKAGAELRVHNLLDVGQKYMAYLIEKGPCAPHRRNKHVCATARWSCVSVRPLVCLSVCLCLCGCVADGLVRRRVGQFEEAAALCPRVLKTNQSLWDYYIHMFLELRQHRVRHPLHSPCVSPLWTIPRPGCCTAPACVRPIHCEHARTVVQHTDAPTRCLY
jgi:hypothetical protein